MSYDKVQVGNRIRDKIACYNIAMAHISVAQEGKCLKRMKG